MIPTANSRRRESLGPEEIHVWFLRADVEEEVEAAASATLSADESERIRASVPAERQRRALRAAWRRTVLAGYLGCSPAALRFRRHPSGSLVLDSSARLTFSTTHAGDLTLLAVAWGRSVGIDVEPVSAAAQIEEIADSYLPRERVRRIRTRPRARRQVQWVRLWTELEACSKLNGRGLGDLDPVAAETLLRQPGHRLHFRPDADHVSAVVYDGGPCRVSGYRLAAVSEQVPLDLEDLELATPHAAHRS